MAQLNFNAQTVAPATGQLDAMPKGWYNAHIESSEMKPTSQGNGAYLELKFSILSGKFANRKVFARLNLQNANPIAQEIAYKELSAICHAVNVLSVQDSSQLHNLPLKIRLKIRKGDGDYDDRNEITAFKNINEQVVLADDDPANAAAGAPAGMAPPMAPPMAPQAPQFQQPAPQFQQPAPQYQPQAPAPQFQQPAPQAPAPQQPQAPQQPWQNGAQQPWQQPQAPQAPAPQYQQAPQAPQAPAPQAPAPQMAPQAPQAPAWNGVPADPQQAQQLVAPWEQQPQQ